MSKKLTGVITALVTPFKDERVDFFSLEQLVENQLKAGITGFVVNGTTGESPTLSTQEREEIFAKVKNLAGSKCTLIMGTGTNNTATTIAATKRAAELGADAALVVTPYYNRPPQTGLIEHFRRVSQEATIPILLYNVPSRTGVSMTADTVADLSREKNIVGIKEASGKLDLDTAIISATKKSFLMISGDDSTFLPLTKLGGQGVISVVSHIIPKVMCEMYQKIKSGDLSVMSLFEELKPLIDSMGLVSNPIPVKYALYRMGIIATDDVRLPLVKLNDTDRKMMDLVLQKFELMEAK